MEAIQPENITIDPVPHPRFAENGVSVAVLRLDKLHAVVAGNKWFKLRYYLEAAKQQDKPALLSYGGAWSNHLVALAAASRQAGLNSIGIIRGEATPTPTPALQEMMEYGMELHFLSRGAYREKALPRSLSSRTDFLTVPEGGYGPLGAEGAATIAGLIPPGKFSHWACAAGTGTMAAGLLMASAATPLLVVSALRNNHSLLPAIEALTPGKTSLLRLIEDYHFGGFARHNPGLLAFMNDWYRHSGIPSDIVYTAKMFFGIYDLAGKGYFPPGSSLLLVHSGGLQGNRSLPKGSLIF